MADGEGDRRRPGDRHGLVGVGEVRLEHEAGGQDEPRQRPGPAHPRGRGEPQRAPHRQYEGELLAGLDEHQASHVELQHDGGGHGSDNADGSEDAAADEPHADDGGDVRRRYADCRAPVGVELGERGQGVELQRPQVVEPRPDLPGAHRPGADERVV